MLKIGDTQFYDLTWGKLEKVFGDNPNWENEIDLYSFLYETMLEEGRDILKEFDILVSAFGAEGADRSRFNQFQQMVLKSTGPAEVAPGREDDERIMELPEVEFETELGPRLHSLEGISDIDDLLKKSYSLNPTPEGTETDQSIGESGSGKDYIDRQEKKKKFNPSEKPLGAKIVKEGPPTDSSAVKYD